MPVVKTDRTPQRVLHLVDHLALGGAEHAVVQMATRVDRTRFAPMVSCFQQSAYFGELATAGCPVHIVPKRRAFDVRLLFALVRLLRRERVALLHCHDLQSATYGALAGPLTRVPVIYTIQGAVVYTLPRAGRLLPWIGRLHRRVVFVARYLQEIAVARYGMKPSRTLVIHNAADLNAFRPRPRDAELARSVGIDPADPVVGTVGNLRPVKNHAMLLRAFAIVVERFPAAKLVLVGEGDQRPRLEALAAELRLGASVKFLGARSDVPQLLPLFDVFAVSSDSEGLSLAIAEAMACELPVVATDVGGNPETVVHGETGILVPAGDAPAMAGALIELLAQPARRRAFGEAGRRRAQAEFSLEGMVRQYEALYESLT
jgi:glycosyltransferase involved in cell wall biosynthesis